MPSNSRPLRPVESFGPELLRALLEGSKRKVEFELPFKKAVHFRQRANQLRNQMRLQNHEAYPMASQAKITISWPETTEVLRSARGVRWPKDSLTLCKVIIAPSDSEFSDVLKGAGIEITPPLSLDETSSKVEEDILASYVKENPA